MPQVDGVTYPPAPRSESHWPPLATVVVAIGLQVALPDRLFVFSRWILPPLEMAMLLALLFGAPLRLQGPHSRRHRLMLTTTILASAGNGIALIELCHLLLSQHVVKPHQLIIAGTLIWLTNVLIFSLWYWEADRGGPGQRAAALDGEPDFLFPQMTVLELFPDWRPRFLDYLYVSLTNATAFSPTDTMPLTPEAKLMMGLQSLVSLVTIGLVVARAVNIL
jgi:uncharacterized membrane protein